MRGDATAAGRSALAPAAARGARWAGGGPGLTRSRPWLERDDLDLGALTAPDLHIVPPLPAVGQPGPPEYIALSLDELVRLDGRRVLHTLELLRAQRSGEA